MTAAEPIQVLVINDSPLQCRLLAEELDQAGDLHACGCDGNSVTIREQLLHQHPDVILLDLALVSTDALVVLRKLRAYYPVPIIVCADSSVRQTQLGLKALELGASEVARKPAGVRAPDLAVFARSVVHRIRTLARAIRPEPRVRCEPGEIVSFRASGLDPQRYVVALGASTGGTEALGLLLAQAPGDFPPVVIVQHMPAGFTNSFAGRLSGLSALRVTEARDGDPLRPGHALLARGDTHLVIRSAGDGWVARYTHQEPVNRHCPSVDVLFDSVAAAGRRAVGVLLTGMGGDGAQGLLKMRQAGALTIGQSEETCIVYGMPKVASDLGAVMHTAAPGEVPSLIARLLRERQRKRAESAVRAHT